MTCRTLLFQNRQGFVGSPTQAVLANAEAFAYSQLIQDGLNGLSQTVTKIFPPRGNMSNLPDPLGELDRFKVSFESIRRALSAGVSSDLKNQTIVWLTEGVELANEYLSAAKRIIGSGLKVNITQVNKRLDSLLDEILPMVIANANQHPAPVEPRDDSAVINTKNNEVAAAQLALGRLTNARDRYDRAFGQLKAQQEEMGKLMGRIAALDLERIDYAKVLELLREALLLLGNVREQWNQLVLFFSEVAARAEMALSGSLTPFIDQATQAGLMAISRDERAFFVDLLKDQAVEINRQAELLFLMSRTYVDMSNQHLMPRLVKLTSLITITDSSERTRVLNQLTAETNATQIQVTNLVNQRKAIFVSASSQRRVELERYIQQLGGPTTQQLQLIAAAQNLTATFT